jgi:hypothetical protein
MRYRCPTCGSAIVIMAATCEAIPASSSATGEFDPMVVPGTVEWTDNAPAKCSKRGQGCAWRGYAGEAAIEQSIEGGA